MVADESMTGAGAAQRTPLSVQRCMAYTYYNLRYGLGVLAALFPPVLWVVNRVAFHAHTAPDSISGYYHTGMRNYFVATLVSLGLFLVLYRGFSPAESWLLNIAGAGAIGVAFLPTSRDAGSTVPGPTFTAPTLHAVCAVVAFGCMAVVTWFFGPRTLGLVPPQRRGLFRIVYRVLAVAMAVLPLLCLLAARGRSDWLFLLESFALWVFVGYWTAKTFEFRISHAETRAMAGELAHETPTTRFVAARLVAAG